MKRREFIAAIGGAAAWPVVGRAQQPAMPVIGMLSVGSPDAYAIYLAAFRQGLNETGFVEGGNVAIEYRWGHGNNDRMRALAAELVDRQVNVIAAGASAIAAKAATATIPIVFIFGGDPVKSGLVTSLNRPGGNITGVGLFAFSLGAKRLEMLRELIPAAKVIAVLVNPTLLEAETDRKDVEAAAGAIGQHISILNASTDNDFEPTFETMDQQGAEALLVMSDPFFNSRRQQLVALAARHAIPAIYEWREIATIGGLMSYGGSLVDAYRQEGIYTGKILKGAKPADLPVMREVKIELILNQKTAKALGITFPLSLLGRADEVIE
jgi:putative tryptophan/tyrosine transport system substrate-binding protein